ncbi:hypothetical protein M1589_04800 [Candidatus Marsarchaeota archaeon]|jgi:hypothetical protein|nr:hypothetical protein [Candidatus Marsarchaeota archaeon]MCL5115430.1 hypothetical protein [Candidatus Marsarchaeota archaeon]
MQEFVIKEGEKRRAAVQKAMEYGIPRNAFIVHYFSSTISVDDNFANKFAKCIQEVFADNTEEKEQTTEAPQITAPAQEDGDDTEEVEE